MTFLPKPDVCFPNLVFMSKIRWWSYFVMLYMLFAFVWWAMLLLRKNEEAHTAKLEALEIKLSQGHVPVNPEALKNNAEYQALDEKCRRQRLMIIGECSVFTLSLLAGLFAIRRSYRRELKANQQQRNFLLSITHELKSPIASIRLILETLLKRDLPKAQSDRLLNNALSEDERLNNLVENLLLSAKLESAYEPYFEEIDLPGLVSDLLAKCAARCPNVKLSFQNPKDFPLLRADKSGITSLVNNLLENAVKYGGDKPRVDVKLSSHRKTAILEVADQGICIPDDEKRRIFEKFYRVGSEETRQTKGTGLGLFIADQIVKAHKGRIQVLNNSPKGSIFRVEMRIED